MFERLRDTFRKKIPESISVRATRSDILEYHWTVGNDFAKAAEKFDGIYAQATIRTAYPELDDCSPDELEELQRIFYESTLKASESTGASISKWAMGVIKPGRKQNILAHEKQHLDPLPDNIRRDSLTDLTFYQDERDNGAITIKGVARFDCFRAGPRILAIVESNPEALHRGDKQHALYCAKQTGDRKFVEFIKNRAKTRQHIRRPR